MRVVSRLGAFAIALALLVGTRASTATPRIPTVVRILLQNGDTIDAAIEAVIDGAIDVRLPTGELRHLHRETVRNFEELVAEWVPPEAQHAASEGLRVNDTRRQLDANLANARDPNASTSDRVAAGQELNARVEAAQRDQVVHGMGLIGLSWTAHHPRNAADLRFYLQAGGDAAFLGKPAIGGPGIGFAGGFAPLNTPDWRIGLKGSFRAAYWASANGAAGVLLETTSSALSYDVRVDAAGFGQLFRVEGGYFGWSGSWMSKLTNSLNASDDKTDDFAFATQGLVLGGRIAPCISHEGVRCDGRLGFGLDRFEPLSGELYDVFHELVAEVQTASFLVNAGWRFGVDPRYASYSPSASPETGWGFVVMVGVGFDHEFE